MIRTPLAAALLGALALAAPSALLAANAAQAGATIEISGFVPVICRAQLDASQAQGGQSSLGQMSEFCNDAGGYEVWADYSPSLAGGVISVDGHDVALTGSGTARIDASSGPASASKSVTLSAPDGATGTISIRVVAL